MNVQAASLAAPLAVLSQPGIFAFLVVFGMGVMLFFVFRSMSKHLRKVNQAAREQAAELSQSQAVDEKADLGNG